MQFSRKTWLGALAVAALCAASVGAAPLPAGIKAGALEADKWMVPDAEMVVTVNFKNLLGSAVMKKGGTDELKKMLKDSAELDTLFKAAGVDPFKDVDVILVSATLSKDAKVMTVVRGSFNPTKFHAAAEKFAKDNDDKLKVSKSGTTNLYEVQAPSGALVAAFADKSTLVLTPSKEATVDALKTAGKKAVKVNKKLLGLTGKFTGKETMTMAMLATDDLRDALKKVPQAAEIAPDVESITASMNLTDAFQTTINIHTTDAKSGMKLKGLLTKLKALGQVLLADQEGIPPVVGTMLEETKITSEKGTVTMDLKVTEKMMKKAGDK